MAFNWGKITGNDEEKKDESIGSKSNVEKLAGEIADMNYNDFTKGDEYKDLAKRYSDQGKLAMDDTIGQVSARTGGLASSYAVGAGNQAYNGYMQKLEDTARSLYDSERAEKKDNLSIAQGIYAQDYQEERDDVADSKWQQEFKAQNNQWSKQYNDSLIDKTIQNFSDNLYSQFYYGEDVSWEQISQSGDLPVGFTEADFNRIRNQALEDKGNKDKSDSDAKREEAIQNIENYLAAGVSMSQIANNHEDWIVASGYGMDYWNQVEKSIIAAKTPTPEFRPVSVEADERYRGMMEELKRSFDNGERLESATQAMKLAEQIALSTGNEDYAFALLSQYFPDIENLVVQ